jgi:hypothetical protein
MIRMMSHSDPPGIENIWDLPLHAFPAGTLPSVG